MQSPVYIQIHNRIKKKTLKMVVGRLATGFPPSGN